MLLALHAPGARGDLRDRDAAGIVDVKRQVAQRLRRVHEAVPFRIGEAAGADLAHLDLGLLRENARGQLRGRHFQREQQHRRAALGFGAFGFVFGPHVRRIERHVGGKRRLPHAGTAGDDDEVGGMQAAKQGIEIGESRRHARDVAAARERPLRARDRLRERNVESERAFAEAALLRHAVERFLRLLDLFARADLDRRFEGRVDDVLADPDQLAPHREVGEDACVILDVGKCRGGARETDEIGVTADLGEARILLHERLQGERRDDVAFRPHALDRFIETLMQGIVEMLGLEQIGDALERIVVDQDRTQQRLLDVDVVGNLARSVLLHGRLS